MTELQPPGYLQAEEHPANQDRLVTAALLGAGVDAFTGGVGVDDPSHGVVLTTDLKVTQDGTPNMSVDVAEGMAFIRGTESNVQGSYHVVNDDTVNLVISTSDPTNARWDLVIAQVRDAGGGYSGSDDDWRLTVVTGTPAGSPADPSLTAYPNALVLARVVVGAGATSITDANITDLRPYVGPWIGSFSNTSASSLTSGTTELLLKEQSTTVTFHPGHRYLAIASFTAEMATAGDVFNIRVRCDSITGQQIDIGRISYGTNGPQQKYTAIADFTPTVTGSGRKIVLTAQRQSGSGGIRTLSGSDHRLIVLDIT